MSKGQTLRALVNERLTAAAEDIFALFERTIAEYEEELCRSKEENERKQQLLDSVLSPQIELHRQDVQLQTQSPCLNQGNTDSPQIKESSETLSIKLKQELVQEFGCVVVKNEFEEQTDDSDAWETPASSSTQQMETKCDEDDQKQESSHILDSSGGDEKGKKETRIHYECSFCDKTFSDAQNLKRHIVVHTGEKPSQCPVCAKCFSHIETLRLHMALHSRSKMSEEGQQAKQGCSSLAKKTLQRSPASQRSIGSPTKNTPFSCPFCKKCFTRKSDLRYHILIHTGEKPFPCLQCNMRFNRKSNLYRHLKVHAQK